MLLVHGHRGARAVLPENTLAGFQYAISVGADFVELDVAITADDVRKAELLITRSTTQVTRALLAGKSLLPAGVTATVGRFDSGDTVSVIDEAGREVARGIAGYSEGDTARILGRRSGEIEALLGYRGRHELIHRDDLVILRHE